MIRSRIIILLACTLGFIYQTTAQRGKDGDYTVTTANQVLNTYTSLSANATIGSTSITVANNAMAGGVFAGNLAAGDLLMIVQMYGADCNIDVGTVDNGLGDYTVSWGHVWWPNNDWWNYVHEWGEIWGYNNAGKFEQVEVLSVGGGGVINLQCGLKNNYTSAKRVQVIRIPRFESLTVNAGASIVPTLWNGVSGGVVALEVNTDLTMNAGSSITADGYGFRGGQVDLSGSSGSNSPVNWATGNGARFFGTSNAFEGSEKGESIFGWHAELDVVYSRYGTGAIANGGGGAGYENAGGGGGSNIYNGVGIYTGNGTPIGYAGAWNQEFAGFGGSTSPGGGRGGYSLARSNQDAFIIGPNNTAWLGDARKVVGGRGAHPLTYDPTRLFFGGGGGAGDDNSNQGGSGGRGGGIVYISNFGTTSGTGTISANGQDGQNANPNNFVILPPGIDRIGVDGAGGGGAGGAIYIENAGNLPGTITLSSQGGDGGNQVLQYEDFSIPREASGPGGSGTGGSIAFNSGAPTQQLNAGVNGTSTSISSGNLVAEFPPNGATTGNNGAGSLPAPYFDITANDVVLCTPGIANLTATILGSLPPGYTVQWYSQQFGGAVLTTGLNYSPNVPATTTFYVGTCPGTFRIPVTVTILPGTPNLVITDPAPVCAPNTVDITLPAVTAGSDAGTLTYWTDAGATTPYGTPTAATTGTYYIQLDVAGCTTVEAVNVSAAPAPNLVVTDPAAVCAPNTVDITDPAVTAGSDAGTLTYWTDAGATVSYVTPAAATNGTYYIQLDVAGCTSIEAVNVVVNPTPNLVVTDPAAVCTPGTVDITLPAVTAGSDAGALTYWTDAGATVSYGTPAAATNGTYYIQLDVTGCTSIEAVNVTVNPSPNLIVADPAAVCAPATVDITAAAVTAGSDAGTLTYWTDAGATVSYGTPAAATNGMYYIELEDGNGCTTIEAVNATVNAQPVVTATNDGPACAGGDFNLNETGGDATGWAWSTGGGAVITVATDQSPFVTGAVDGEVFTVIVTDANGCTNTANTSITIIPGPSLDPIADVTVCETYVLPAITGTDLTGAQAYYNDSQAAGGTVISGTLTTSQTVWVFDGSGACNDEISFVLTVNPLPTVISVSGNGTYCTGDVPADVLVEVSGTGPWTLDYNMDGVPQTANSATSAINLGNAPGVYVLTSLADAYCTDAVNGTVTITVNSTPATPIASEDGDYCVGEFIPAMTVSGTGGTYNWYLDPTLTSTIGIGNSHVPSEFIGTTVYYVTETIDGCQSASDSVLITMQNCEVIYPSAFTPDGDLTNDTWELPGLDQSFPDNIVRVYNRWGNLIFEHNSSVTNPYSNNEWDGTHKGKKLPVASYYYIIELNNDAKDTVKGTVTIVLND